jgi:iron-sulfur cluster repair protein YtfE (RIC family)
VKTIAHIFENDHVRILSMLTGIISDTFSREKQEVLQHIIRLLQRHLRIEEDLFFPAIERSLGICVVPTLGLLRRRHT